MSLLSALKLPTLAELAATRAAVGQGSVNEPQSGAPGGGVASAVSGGAEASTRGSAKAAISAVQFSIPVKVPEADLGYVTAGGSASYVVSCKPAAEDEADVEVKFKNMRPEVEAKLKQKYGKDAELSGGVSVSDKEGTVGVGLDLTDSATEAKTSFAFHIVKMDAEHAKVEFAALEWSQTYPLKRGELTIADMKLKTEGRIEVKITAQPNWKKIAADLLERFGVSVAEDAALGVAAGGTGTAGAAAVAAASSPLIVVTGGIVGGLALTAGAMKWIDALEAAGRDATDVCVLGAKQLRAYAESYGSTMRGTPGKNAKSNQDAEAALQAIMAKAPGMTREQAIEAARQSKQNFENLAYRALLPAMREQVKKAYDEKHPWTPDNTLMIVMNEVLDENGRY
ncbi:MAG: hypothetical protein ACXWIZ_08645 [Caldimonas sp.]